MPIGLDYKLDKVIKEIQAEMKSEMGVELDYDIIVAMAQQQIDTTVSAMSRGDSVVWKFFGTFSANQRRIDLLNKRYDKIGKKPTLISVDSGFYQMNLTKRI